jgi:RimJ/RimL family protein N-acetyltransferase
VNAGEVRDDAGMDQPLEAKLRDGTLITIRPILPEDRQQLAEGFARLEDRSRYLRFHTSMRTLTPRQLSYLTEVDHVDHEALVAVRSDDGRGLGVARYIRLQDDPEVAEAALTIADEWQGRGLGTLLLRALASSALRNGVRVFRNYVLAENDAMIALFDELGASRTLQGRGVYRVDFELPGVEVPRILGRNPGRT